MADELFSPITNALPLPDAFEGITTALGSIFEKIGLSSLDFEVSLPQPDDDPTEPEEAISEEESIEQLRANAPAAWDVPAPVPPEDADLPAPVPLPEAFRTVNLHLTAFSEIQIALPGLDGVTLVLNPGDFVVKVTLSPDGVKVAATLALALRFARTLLVPMNEVGSGSDIRFEVDEAAPFVQIDLASATIEASSDGRVDVQSELQVELTRPAMIGDTGVLIRSAAITLNLTGEGDRPDNAPDGWKGVLLQEAEVRIPSVFNGAIRAEKLGFGSGGVTGEIAGLFNLTIENGVVTGDLTGAVLGMQGGISEISLVLTQNIPTEARLSAKVLLPIFDFGDPVDLEISLALNGQVSARLSTSPGPTLTRAGLAKLELKSLEVGLSGGEVFTSFSGTLTPLVAGTTWPSLEVKDLRVDSAGNVSFAGGWVDLPQQKTLTLANVFTVEITKIGFGKEDDGRRWIGFTGGLRIVDGFSAGATVEGLRILWRSGEPPTISLTGVAIDLEIANVLSLKGRAKFEEQELQGAIKLGLETPKLLLDGQFRAGKITRNNQTSSFFAVFVDVQLPVGIPIATSGLSLYGIAGLFGYNFEPDRGASEGWYHNPDFSKGWFPKTPAGVTNLDKWRPTPGSLAFGAGITIGTSADDGNKFNGRLVLAVVFPGPIIILEGRANLFKKRAKLLDSEPNFLAAAIYDGRAGTFLIGLDAQYKYKSKGELLDVRGSAEAFFNLKNTNDWHVHLGQRDPNKRLRARAFQLFDVNAFFMLDPRTLDVGSGWSFNRSWSFGRLSVGLSASFEKEAIVSFKPNHFTGIMAMQGRAELRAFGRSVGVGANAQIKADVFDPKHIRGEFKVGINLPWPLPDISKTVTLEWTSALTSQPPLPLPLRDASIDHAKSTLRWPVERGASLLPNNDQGGLEWRGPGRPAPAPGNAEPPPPNRPVVAADSKLSLVFSRAISDPAMIGNNPTGVPADVIGDVANKRGAYTVNYALKSVVLQKRAPSSVLSTPEWVTVARKGENMRPTEVALYGAWWPQTPPELPVSASADTAHSQVKLVLNAKSPFEATALINPEWLDAFETNNAGYPCPPASDSRNLCANFSGFEDGTSFPNVFEFQDPPFVLRWQDGGNIAADDTEYRSGLRLATTGTANPGSVRIIPPPGTTEVRITIGTPLNLVHEPSEFGDPRGTFQLSDTHPTIAILDGSVQVSTYQVVGSAPPAKRQVNSVVLIRETDDFPALRIGNRGDFVELIPAEPALVVELELDAQPIINGGEDADRYGDIELYDSTSATEPFHVEPVPFELSPLRRRLKATAIARVVVRALTTDNALFLKRVYFRTPVVAHVVRDIFEFPFPTYREENGVVVARDEDIREILLGSRCGGEFLIKELCIANHRKDRIDHAFQALEQFKRDDELFEPEADYRLVVTTRRTDKDKLPTGFTKGPADASAVNADNFFEEQVYFKVAGPPGIGVPRLPPPLSPPQDAPQGTGLEDLRLYVNRTVPEAVRSEPNAKPELPRGVYRAYDLKVEFNENYVESMYKRARRDLTLRVYDGANRPLLDDEGRVLVGPSTWARTTAPLKDAVTRWIRMVNGATCREGAPFDENAARRDQALSAPDERVRLAPETLHQARLIPALLRESFVEPLGGLFADGQGRRLERWRAENTTGASRWQIRSQPVTGPDGQPAELFYVTETLGAESTLLYEGPIAAETGPDRPSEWTDVRATAKLRWEAGEAGIELRRGATGVVRVVFDRATGTSRLLFDGVARGEVPATLPDVGSNLQVTLEFTGDRVLVAQDGTELFDETGAPVGLGPLGLYVKSATNVRFSDVAVDDLRANPATAFKFDFVTSKYVNFHHHLHSFDDRSFPEPLEAAKLGTPALLALFERAVSYAETVSDDERRACEALLEALLGSSGMLARSERVEAVRVTREGAVIGVLLRSPDPLLWDRISLGVDQSSSESTGATPSRLKLTELRFAGSGTEPEGVTILARERGSLSGYRLEFRTPPLDPADGAPWNEYYAFGDEEVAAEGTQIRVVSTAPELGPPREPGTRQRFVFDDAALVHDFFGTDAVEVRLVGPDDVVLHQRVFLPNASYSSQDFRVLRKPDGTELFIVAPTNAGAITPLSGTRLRLSFAFERQKASNPVVLSQAGSTASESAVLEVPLD